MNKKELAQKAYAKNTDAIPYPVDRVLHAIIDALPEPPAERVPMKECPVCGKKGCREYHREWKKPEKHWHCPDGATYPYSPGGFVPANAFLVSGSEPVEAKESQPTSDWHRVYQMAKELMQLSEVRPVSELDPKDGQCSDLGPQQPPNVASGATQSPEGCHQSWFDGLHHFHPSEDQSRKLRIMKAMEERSHPDAKFTYQNGVWTECSRAGQPEIADPEEQRIDKEIAEVKAKADVLVRKCDKLVDLARYAARQLRDNDAASVARTISAQLDYILGNQPEPPAMGGVPATPESVAEKLWEGKGWTNGPQFTIVDMSAYEGWRRIKVREVRGE